MRCTTVRITSLSRLVVLLSLWAYTSAVAADDKDAEEERWNDAWEEKEMLSKLFDSPNPPLSYRMSNGRDVPLIGLGVGNLQHDLIEEAIVDGLGEFGDYRLIDTASASKNEDIVASAINVARQKMAAEASNNDVIPRGLRKKDENSDSSLSNSAIHVVTKVWYTHLGYERTKLAVKESLENLQIYNAATTNNGEKKNLLRIHLLLHWPQCDDNIPWMHCKEEEENLPQYVKDTGPPPHLNPDAWKDSWRALEELYLKDRQKQRSRYLHNDFTNSPNIQIESIGVSNFNLDQMKSLVATAKVKPHLFQGNIWSIVYNADLMTYLHHHNIVFQAYGVMLSIIQRKNHAPNAYELLEIVGEQLAEAKESTTGETDNTEPYEASQVVLAWLTQHDFAVVLRSSQSTNRHINSPQMIESIPELTDPQQLLVTRAVKALLAGKDLPDAALNIRHSSNKATIQSLSGTAAREEEPRGVFTTFYNALTDPVHVFWSNSRTGEEHLVGEDIEPGMVFEQVSHPGHTFVVYDSSRQRRKEFKVSKEYGQKEHFHVEL